MAKDEQVEGQMELIDVDDPKFKDVKRELKGYETMVENHREQHSADKKAEEAKKAKVLSALHETGIQPDAEGAYHVILGGKEYVISQPSQLKITKRKAPAGAEGEQEGDSDD